jgi:hypothetical protein
VRTTASNAVVGVEPPSSRKPIESARSASAPSQRGTPMSRRT